MYFLDFSRNICSSPIPEMYKCDLFGTGSLKIYEVKKKLSELETWCGRHLTPGV